MNRKIFLLPAFLIMFWTAGAQDEKEPQTKTSFSLKEAQEFAVLNNTGVKNAMIDAEIADRKVWETTAIGLPQVNASAGYNYYPDIPTQLMPDFISMAVIGVNQSIFGLEPTVPISSDPQYFEIQFGQPHNANFGITLNQIIFNGEYLVGLQASKTFKGLAEQSLNKTLIQTKATVTENYLLALMTADMKKTLDESFVTIKNAYNDTKAIQQAGFLDSTDVDQLQIQVTSLENTLKSFDRQHQTALMLLKIQMGYDPKSEITLTQTLEEILKDINVNDIMVTEYTADNHIDYQLLNTQVTLSELSMKRERSKYLPSLSAFVSHQQNAMRQEFNFFSNEEKWFPTTMVGVSLSIPIFSSGMKHSKVVQSKLELEKSMNLRDNTYNLLNLQLQQAKNSLVTAYEKYLSEQKNLDLTKRIYDNTLIKFKNGKGTSLELTQAQNQMLTTRANYFSAIFELLNAKNTLDKAINNY